MRKKGRGKGDKGGASAVELTKKILGGSRMGTSKMSATHESQADG